MKPTARCAKSTGIPWQQTVPSDWTVVRIKYVLEEKKTRHDPELPCGALSFGSVVYKDGERVPEETRATYQEVLAGEFLINPINLNYDLKSLRTALADINVCVSPAYIVLRVARDAHKPFLRYLVHQFDVAHMKTLGAGVRQTITYSDIGNCHCGLPPFSEQVAVAKFLDRETARIDALIEKKTRFIELLREKRQALITQAVTRGLDPTVPLKDSGVPWLGLVPANWTVMALSRITLSRCDGPFGSAIKSEHYVDEGVRVVRLQNISTEGFRGDDAAYLSPEYHRDEIGDSHDVQPGDLLMAGLGDQNNPLGRTCVAPADIGNAIVKADCYRFRVDRRKAAPSFIAHQLSATASVECGFMSTGATRDRLNLGLAASRRIALPPTIDEQSSIADSLARVTRTVDRQLQLTARSLELLAERRAALITAAVTGQIDVRAEATEEVTEPA